MSCATASAPGAHAVAGGAAAFLAQRIVQEMDAAGCTAPGPTVDAMIAAYRAVPCLSVTYEGPQIPFDIAV